MGSIKLILGDCLQEMKKIPDKSIDLIVTDPPYNLGYTGRGKQNFSVFANDNQTSEEFNMWFEKVITEIYRLIKDCGAFYCWCDYRIYPHIFHIINKFFIIKNCIIWRKNNFGMGQHYRFQHEFCVYAIKGEHKLILDKRNQSDVWEFKKDDVSSYRHPTQKPVFAMYKPIEFSSQRGG